MIQQADIPDIKHITDCEAEALAPGFVPALLTRYPKQVGTWPPIWVLWRLPWRFIGYLILPGIGWSLT